ncbi:MAG TPA: DUF72 domain-containing protein [Polyangiaceae bacterium]|jgi:uncharacterized protein YecE (DUF72 family)
MDIPELDLRVGLSSLRGELARYAERYDLLELRADPQRLPRLAELRRYKTRVGTRFVFAVALPSSIGELNAQPGSNPALSYALTVADALEASWLLLQTPASVSPSDSCRRRLADLLKGLRDSRRRIAWEPRGVWDPEQAARFSQELGVALVCDLTRVPPPPGITASSSGVVYSRFLSLGSARIRGAALERAAESLRGFREAYVVMDGPDAARSARAFRQAAAELGLIASP